MDMIERVALAMYDDYRDPPDLDSGLPWDEMDADARSPWLQSARVALKAMRRELEIARQALREVEHAQRVGENWYTEGRSSLYQQVTMWVKKGSDALDAALSTPPEPVGREK